jgi:hypothetical protein
MSLLNRKPTRIGRAQREQRDDRVFLVATEDTYAPKQYFEGIRVPRVKVLVLESQDGLVAPHHVVDRLREAFRTAQHSGDYQEGDQLWVVLDTDHHVKVSHLKSTVHALDEARREGFIIAVSNPSFELWLLLHHEDVTATSFKNSQEVASRLRVVLGEYNKCNLQLQRFGQERIPAAIRRARSLEENPDSPKGHWPEQAGTRVYLLLQALGFSPGD